MNQPNSAQIRQLVSDTFSDEDFTIWCYDYYRDVYERFAGGMSKPQKIQLLVEHCERSGLLPQLLVQIEAVRGRHAGHPAHDRPDSSPAASTTAPRSRLILAGLLAVLVLVVGGYLALSGTRAGPGSGPQTATPAATPLANTPPTATSPAPATPGATATPAVTASAVADAAPPTATVTRAASSAGFAVLNAGNASAVQPVSGALEEPGEVTALQFAPNGARLATGLGNGTLRLARLAVGRRDGKPIVTRSVEWTSSDHLAGVFGLAFRPDGRAFVSVDGDGVMKLWDEGSDTPSYSRQWQTDALTAVKFTPDGRLLALGTWGDPVVYIWRIADRRLLQTLSARGQFGEQVVFDLDISPDGSRVAAGAQDGNVRIWRVEDGELLQRIRQYTEPFAVGFAPDGRTLAASSENLVNFWNVASGTLRNALERQHSDDITTLAYAPGGDLLATGSRDKTVRLWRVEDGVLLRTLQGHTAAINAVRFSPDGTLLATASQDTTVRIWAVTQN